MSYKLIKVFNYKLTFNRSIIFFVFFESIPFSTFLKQEDIIFSIIIVLSLNSIPILNCKIDYKLNQNQLKQSYYLTF